MNKPVIHFRSRHETGNIFVILAMVLRALQEQGRADEFNGIRDRVTASKSYREALDVIWETVDLVDDDEEEKQ